jgi:hypothetical protein
MRVGDISPSRFAVVFPAMKAITVQICRPIDSSIAQRREIVSIELYEAGPAWVAEARAPEGSNSRRSQSRIATMVKLMATTAVFLLAGCSTIGGGKTVYAQMMGGILMPPERFDHYPTEPFRLTEVDARTIRAFCPKAHMSLGCAFMNTRRILIRNDLSPGARDLVLRHEYAHLNGWTH